MTTDNERTVTVTILSAAKVFNTHGEADYKLECAADFFRSRYPTIIYVPEDVGASIGTEATFVLRAQLKDGKDGTKPYDFNWRFVSLGDRDVEAREAIAHPIQREHTTVGRQAPVLSADPTRTSIERQTALIQANLLAANGVLIPPDEDVVGAILLAADRYIAWLQDKPNLVQQAIGATLGEPELDETQEPTDAGELPF